MTAAGHRHARGQENDKLGLFSSAPQLQTGICGTVSPAVADSGSFATGDNAWEVPTKALPRILLRYFGCAISVG
jgi:hypothetical protein